MRKVWVGLLLFVVSLVAFVLWFVDEAGSRRRAAERQLKRRLQFERDRRQWAARRM